ncbi:MAG: DNA repair protein RecO [Rikenellaceae bacterium]
MLQKLQLIVLHTIKYRDTSLIVQGYSNLGGRQSFVIRTGRSTKNYAALSLLHPLSIIDAELVAGSWGDMATIKECTPAYKLSEIRCNLHKSSIAIFISELIYRTIKEIEQNTEMYNFISRSVLQLETLESGFANFHAYFIVELCKHIGYTPESNYSHSKPLFDIVSAGFTDNPVMADMSFSLKSSSILAAILNIKPESLCSLKITGNERYSFIKDMIKYISHHIGYQIEIRSLNVLHEVFE